MFSSSESDSYLSARSTFLIAWRKSRKISQLWLKQRPERTQLESPLPSSIICLHCLPHRGIVSTGHFDGIVRCYEIATWRKIGCFYAAPQQVSHHNGRLSRLPVMRLADDGGSRLVACAGSYLRFYQADTADVSSAPINLSAASPAPLTNLVIRNKRIYLTDFFDRIVVHPLSIVEGGTDLDKPLFKRNIRGIVDFRVDDWRLYLLVDDNAEPGIHFYSLETFERLGVYSISDCKKFHSLLPVEGLLLCAGQDGIIIIDGLTEEKLAAVPLDLGENVRLHALTNGWIVSVNKDKTASVIDGKKLMSFVVKEKIENCKDEERERRECEIANLIEEVAIEECKEEFANGQARESPRNKDENLADNKLILSIVDLSESAKSQGLISLSDDVIVFASNDPLPTLACLKG